MIDVLFNCNENIVTLCVLYMYLCKSDPQWDVSPLKRLKREDPRPVEVILVLVLVYFAVNTFSVI